MGNYTIVQMFENPRRGRQARNFTKNVPKIQISNRLPNRYFPKIDVGCPRLFVRQLSQMCVVHLHLQAGDLCKCENAVEFHCYKSRCTATNGSMVKKLHQLKEGKEKLYLPTQTLLRIDENVSCSMEKHFLTAFGD